MESHRLFRVFALILLGLFFSPSINIEAKKAKKSAGKKSRHKAQANSGEHTVANNSKRFVLKPLEVVFPIYFTEPLEANEATNENLAQNATFLELPNFDDNEFAVNRKKVSVREKWVGRQFLIIMQPNEYKEAQSNVKSTEVEDYPNATLLGEYDFKRKLFPLLVGSGCIDIGAEYKRSSAYEYFDETKYLFTYLAHQVCLKSLLGLDFSFAKDRYPDYYIPISETEAEALKANFEAVQIGIVAAWLADDTGEVKGETIEWGKFEYNRQLGPETLGRLNLNWTALECFIRYKDKIYQSKIAPNREKRFMVIGHDSTKTRQLFKEETDNIIEKGSESETTASEPK